MTQVDFAIITTHEDEFAAVSQRFPTEAQKGASGRTYAISQVQTKFGKDCMVALVCISEQDTAIIQQIVNDMFGDLNPQMLLSVGITSAIPSDDFTLGDVIVSTRIDNLNVSKQPEDGKEEFDIRLGIYPGMRDISASLSLYDNELIGWNTSRSIRLDRPKVNLQQFETEEMVAKRADSNKNALWYKTLYDSMILHFGNEKRSKREPFLTTGWTASSNTLIRNVDLLIQWLQTARNILAVEMESAGVYQAARRIRQQYPIMAIRGISDIIGLEHDNQWTKYACQTAAAFAYAFVRAEVITPRATSIPESTSSATTQGAAVQSKTQTDSTEPIDLFISYAENDEISKRQLETHLTLLRREEIIRPWHSQQTKVGARREKQIANLINSAQIILLLMSPSFIASDQLYEKEMIRAINRQSSGDAVRVISIAVHPIASSDLDKTPYQKMQGLPRSGKPIDSWRDPDEAWARIVQEIRKVCKDLRESTSKY